MPSSRHTVWIGGQFKTSLRRKIKHANRQGCCLAPASTTSGKWFSSHIKNVMHTHTHTGRNLIFTPPRQTGVMLLHLWCCWFKEEAEEEAGAAVEPGHHSGWHFNCTFFFFFYLHKLRQRGSWLHMFRLYSTRFFFLVCVLESLDCNTCNNCVCLYSMDLRMDF